MIVMATGHRELNNPDLIAKQLAVVFEQLKPDYVISGGAEGADTVFAEVAVQMDIPLHVYLPNRYYRSYYSRSISDMLLAKAEHIEYSVDRESTYEWQKQWADEKWWRDNFARNTSMVKATDLACCISSTEPKLLKSQKKGGTASCLRELVRLKVKTVWIRDPETKSFL